MTGRKSKAQWRSISHFASLDVLAWFQMTVRLKRAITQDLKAVACSKVLFIKLCDSKYERHLIRLQAETSFHILGRAVKHNSSRLFFVQEKKIPLLKCVGTVNTTPPDPTWFGD